MQSALNFGNYVSVGVSAVFSYLLIQWMLPAGDITIRGFTFDAMHVFLRRAGGAGSRHAHEHHY